MRSIWTTPRTRWLPVALAATLAMTVAPMPTASAHPGHEHEATVLIFTETTQFRHTEAIVQGTPVLQAAFTEAGIDSVHTEDSSIFSDEGLADFDALVMFQTSGDPWTADEKGALERYQQAGGGIVAIHNATDMRGSYPWWDALIGTLMPGHAATGSSPGLPGTVRVEDQVHPSTAHLPQRWDRADEWYNFSTNVRGDAHVLATMDESTYDAGGNAMGADHPISWCKPYDGGRAWATGMGHFGAHYTDEPDFVQHIVGGVQWAAGLVEGDCGGTKWSEYEKVSLDTNTSAPFAMDIAPDGRVFYTELVRGQIRVFDPTTQATTTAATIPVYSGGEDGLLGIVLANDFADTGHLYVYYSPASANDTDPANFWNRLSRFTVEGSSIDLATEQVLLEVPARRLPDEPGHTGGGLDMDAQGNLYLGVGDDVNPHSEPSGGYAPLSNRPGTFHDARVTSANTNDLRGKLLRITPQPDGSYTIPEGNLFAPGTELTRPEIYAMGFRNPFRFSVDQASGAISLADYSPDNGSDNPNRGPAGIAEWHLVTEPGNFGWPMCMGRNEPFRDIDYTTSPVTVGEFFDCDAPVNDSPANTGLTELPPAVPADLAYGYQRTTAPGVINAGGGLAPMGGPVYTFDPALESDTKFPQYYDGKPFFYEWARNRMYSVTMSETDPGSVEKVNPFLPPPAAEFLAPIDSRFGPDGSLYVLDWGGGFGRDNPNSGLHRIDYITGSRSPVAVATASPDSGPAPLVVEFDGSGSSDPEGATLAFAWDFDSDGVVDSTAPSPTHTYTTNGTYDARLTVTDPEGKTGTTTVPITVGNTRPMVEFVDPPNGGFFTFGDEVAWDLSVTDAEDVTIDDADVIIQPALGHDAHAHPAEPLTGRTGSVVTSLGGGHSEDMNVFYVLDGRYTDSGGEGAPPLTGSDTTILYPMQREAEFFSSSQDLTTLPSRDVEGGGSVVAGSGGAWGAYDPINLRGVDQLVVRASATTEGTVELRRDAPDGPLLGSGTVSGVGGLTRFHDVVVDVQDPGETFALYVVLPGEGERRINFVEAVGTGATGVSRPVVAITSPQSYSVLETGDVQVTAEASDAQHAVTQVEFFVDGTSVGVDTQAPYEATWSPTADGLYDLTAVATNDQGRTTTSRTVVAQVGELFGDLQTFTNAGGQFEATGSGAYTVTSGGANMWMGTDQYSALYLPAAADEDWTATVRIDSQGNSNGSAKAGLVVRNDVTQPGVSPGYAAMGIRPSNGFEWLRDMNANGQLDASSSAGSTAYPAWVRITRDGPEYTAYWSSDGVTFTPVGPPVTLPGAAAVQDIGMFVTAHSGSQTSEVAFSDFVFDTTPPTGPQEPGPGPSCPVVGSDEFDGDALDPLRWPVVRTAPGTEVTVVDGSLVLPVVRGDIDGAGTGPITFVGQPASSGAWEATTRITLQHTRHWQHAGLMLHASDDEYVKLALTRTQAGGRILEFQTETGGSRTWHASIALPQDFPATAELRLTSDGTRLTAAYSTDGQTWTAVDGAAPVKAGAHLGLVAAGDTGPADVNATVDWFRVAPDRGDDGVRAPDDDFDGDVLDGCRWDAVVRYDESTLVVADGELRITTQPGDINGDNPLLPRNLVLQEAPEGDWTAETRLRASMVHRWQYAGLLAYGGDDDYVKLDVVARNQPGQPLQLGAELVSEVAGGFGAGGNRSLDVPATTESGWWYLRLTRTGDTYTGWVSEGGISWTQLGEPVTNAGDLDRIGLIAVGPEQTQPVTVAFDWFRLSPGEEAGDTTAPTVTATTDPGRPASGWYTGEVVVTAAATDDTDPAPVVEVDVDGTGWIPVTGPVTVSGDGERVVRLRATDAAGNVSEVLAVEVRIDTTAPTSSATLTGRTVTLTGGDTGSGLDRLEYSLRGGPWTTYTEPFGVGAAAAVVQHRAVDVAGNVSEAASLTVPAAGAVQMTVHARATCVDGQVHVAVRVRNLDRHAADIRITTPWGEVARTQVERRTEVSAVWPTGQASVGAGSVTVAGYVWADGDARYTSTQAAYAARTCR